jgi:hypothetical protein
MAGVVMLQLVYGCKSPTSYQARVGEEKHVLVETLFCAVRQTVRHYRIIFK